MEGRKEGRKEGRNFQEVHGKNVIGKIGNLTLSNCVIKVYLMFHKALIVNSK